MRYGLIDAATNEWLRESDDVEELVGLREDGQIVVDVIVSEDGEERIPLTIKEVESVANALSKMIEGRTCLPGYTPETFAALRSAMAKLENEFDRSLST